MNTSLVSILFFLFSTILVSSSYGTPRCDKSGLSNSFFDDVSTSSEECSIMCSILRDATEGKECAHTVGGGRMGPDRDYEGKIFESNEFACIEFLDTSLPNIRNQNCYKASGDRKQNCLFKNKDINFATRLVYEYRPRVSNEELKQVTNSCPSQKLDFPPFNHNVVIFGVHYDEIDTPQIHVREQTKLIVCIQHLDLYYYCNPTW